MYKSVFEQWKDYFNQLHYKIAIEKNIKKVNTINQQKYKEYEELCNSIAEYDRKKKDFVAKLEHESDPDKSLNLYLNSKEIKASFFDSIKNKVFRHDGYIFYLNKADEMKIFSVKNLKSTYSIKNSELYGLDKKIGTYRGKPIFFIKYPHVISLEIEDQKVGWSPEILYNYVNKLTKQNLTNLGSDLGFAEFIRKYWLIILVFVILALLFFTPQGKEFLGGILPKT